MAKLIYSFLIFCLVFFSCTEPYDIPFNSNLSILSIDASINDNGGPQIIVLKKTQITNSNFPFFVPETKATVVLLENSQNIISGREISSGQYQLPIGFKPKLGFKYKLQIKLSNGEEYISTEETIKSTPEISKTQFVFTNDVYGDASNIPGHIVFLDTKDNPEKGDNLMWRWRLFEKQRICVTCDFAYYSTSPAPLGRCISSRALLESQTSYDYECRSDCYEIFYNSTINVFNDRLVANGEIKNRLVARIPFYQPTGCLLEISQENVSEGAFQFNKAIIDQNQSSGTLADSPPTPLIGNIFNVKNKNEQVGGYFTVSNLKIAKLFIPRTENAISLGLLGRPINLEPVSPPASPPLAPCILSKTRTPLKPEGWKP
jgi:hypothetical protein